MAAPRITSIALCAAALAASAGLAACGEHEEPGVDEPAREGLAIDIGGIDYNVFITRQLNLAVAPDKDYYDGPPADPGNTLYGIFLQVCNNSEETLESTDEFVVTDNQGNEFEPMELPEENAFAYRPEELAPGDCTPEQGSVAQLGPTAGSMLLFEFPRASTENRPLELEVSTGASLLEGEEGEETKTFELDL